MRTLSGLGIGLSLVFGCLFLALLAEIYYLLWWKKRVVNRDIEEDYKSHARELIDLFCWKKPSSLGSTAVNHRDTFASARITDESVGDKPFGGDDGIEAELMRIHNIAGPTRLLFTIKEETNEDLESAEGSRKCSRGRSLCEIMYAVETPFTTPLSSPPFFTPPRTPMNCYEQHGFNPLFESYKEEGSNWIRASPPPKFKFLRDAEEKLYRKTLMEEALRVKGSRDVTRQVNSAKAGSSPIDTPSTSSPSEEGDDEGNETFITINIAKNQEKVQHYHHHNHPSSQVIPLTISPSDTSLKILKDPSPTRAKRIMNR